MKRAQDNKLSRQKASSQVGSLSMTNPKIAERDEKEFSDYFSQFEKSVLKRDKMEKRKQQVAKEK